MEYNLLGDKLVFLYKNIRINITVKYQSIIMQNMLLAQRRAIAISFDNTRSKTELVSKTSVDLTLVQMIPLVMR